MIITGAALADDAKVCLDATAVENLASEYKIRCQQNIAELSRFLRVNDVIISETGDFAYNLTFLMCDFSNDPILAKIRNSKNVEDTENAINTMGSKRYSEYAKDELVSTKSKFKIEYIKILAESENRLNLDDVKILFGFAKVGAKSEALVSVVETCR